MDTTIPNQRQPLVDEFTQRNSKINLSAIREPLEVYQKHILDALEIEKIDPKVLPLLTTVGSDWDKVNDEVRESALEKRAGVREINGCDLGTGGWFPLLPLATIYPHIQWTGLDARNKKIAAINDMAQSLGLSNCSAIHSRVEEHNTTYDIVTARAVAYADKLLPRVDHILKPWGTALFYKLFTTEEDKIIQKYWRDIIKKHRYTLWDDDVEKILYVLKKPQ